MKTIKTILFIAGILICFTAGISLIAAGEGEYGWHVIPKEYYRVDPVINDSDFIQAQRTGTCIDVCRGYGMNAAPRCQGWTSASCRKTISITTGAITSANTDCLENDLISRGLLGIVGYDHCCCGESASEIDTNYACADSDGGRDYGHAGTVEHSVSGTRKDYCSGNRVVEFWCQNNLIYSENHLCVSGCAEGACIDEGGTDPNQNNENILNLRAYQITDNSAMISWYTNKEMTCKVKYTQGDNYEHYADGDLVQRGTPENYNQFVYNKKLLGLVRENEYTYAVTCRDMNGIEYSSTVKKFTTTGDAEIVIIGDIDISKPAEGQVLFRWSTNIETSYNYVGYMDLATGSGKSKIADRGIYRTKHEVTVNDIDFDKRYTYFLASWVYDGSPRGFHTENTALNLAELDNTATGSQGNVSDDIGCFDSDGGQNYAMRGICTDGLYPGGIADTCYTVDQVSYNNVKEMFCNTNDECQYTLHECPNGCENGACRQEPAEETGCPSPYHVISPDDRCVWSCAPDSTPDTVSNECVCKTGYTETGEDQFGRRICTPDPNFRCIDSDNGKNARVQGKTTGYGIESSIYKDEIVEFTDKCWGDNGLTEYSCLDGRVFWQHAECSYWIGEEGVCQNGVCAPLPEIKATSSDDLIITNEKMEKFVSGKILIKVYDSGKAYYINPRSKTITYLGRPEDAFAVMRGQGIGITNTDLEKIPAGVGNLTGPDTDGDGLPDTFEDAVGSDKNDADTDDDGYGDKQELENGYSPVVKFIKENYDYNFGDRHKGKIFLRVEGRGEAWYVNPDDGKRYFLGRPADAFAVMHNLGLGISNKDFDNL